MRRLALAMLLAQAPHPSPFPTVPPPLQWTSNSQTSYRPLIVLMNRLWQEGDGPESTGADVAIYPGGVVKIRKGLTIEEGAQKFWEAVAQYMPKQPCSAPTGLDTANPTSKWEKP